jgi:hypothetical protein
MSKSQPINQSSQHQPDAFDAASDAMLPDASSFDRSKVAIPLASVPLAPTGHVDSKDVRKTIEMPDGKTMTYPGTTPDEKINAEWQHRRNIATAKAALFGFGIAVLATVLFSYLLQAAYRALVYVIYGRKAGRPAPDSPVAG